MPRTAARPDNRSHPTKPRISPRSKRAREAASKARASVAMANDAVVQTVYLFAWHVIERFRDGFDDILRAVFDQMPPDAAEAAAKSLLLTAVRTFAESIDRALTAFEEKLRGEAAAAEADIVEQARQRLSNDFKRVSYRLYDNNDSVEIRYANKTLRFTKKERRTNTLMVLLLGQEHHRVRFDDISKQLWNKTDLSKSRLNNIRACKCALERELIAAFGLPPNETRLDAPDRPKKQSWIVADRDNSYSLNTRVLTWTCRSGEMSVRDRVGRGDDLGRHVADPKTLAPRTHDSDSPEDESDGEGSASGTDAMPHHAIGNSSSRARRTKKTAIPLSPSGTLRRRPTAPDATGLHGYVAKRDRKPSGPPAAS